MAHEAVIRGRLRRGGRRANTVGAGMVRNGKRAAPLVAVVLMRNDRGAAHGDQRRDDDPGDPPGVAPEHAKHLESA